MATQWGQTNAIHKDINIQREFERKSSPVMQSKAKSSISGSNPTFGDTGNNAQSLDNQYTVYHNGVPVNTLGMNQSINFTDVLPVNESMVQVSFQLRALGDNGKEDVILSAFVPSKPFYVKRFTLDVLDVNAAQSHDHGGRKYRVPMFHDVIHGLTNPTYSIYSLGKDFCIPEVELFNDTTLRVRSRLSLGYGNYKKFLNTFINYISDINENIDKLDVVEFVIIVEGN